MVQAHAHGLDVDLTLRRGAREPVNRDICERRGGVDQQRRHGAGGQPVAWCVPPNAVARAPGRAEPGGAPRVIGRPAVTASVIRRSGRVRARASDADVVQAATRQRVVARTALQAVVAGLADQRVVVVFAEQPILALAAQHGVVAIAAE